MDMWKAGKEWGPSSKYHGESGGEDHPGHGQHHWLVPQPLAVHWVQKSVPSLSP